MCRLNPALSCMHSSCYPLSDNEDPRPLHSSRLPKVRAKPPHQQALAVDTSRSAGTQVRQVDSQAHGQRTLWKVGGERGKGHRTDRRRQIGEQPTQLDSVNVRFVWHFSHEYELLAVLLSAPVSHTVHLSPSLSRFHSLMLSLSVRVCTRHAAYMCIYKLHYIHALLQAASAAMKKLQLHYAN